MESTKRQQANEAHRRYHQQLADQARAFEKALWSEDNVTARAMQIVADQHQLTVGGLGSMKDCERCW